MKRNLLLFLCAIVVGTVLTSGYHWANAEDLPKGHWLGQKLYVSEQITPRDFGAGRIVDTSGAQTVIDLRPDGEAPDQPPSALMAEEARKFGAAFHYIPVPQGPIPEQAVAQLGSALASASPTGPVLLYCRSGTRAARTWALAEASRPGGADPDTIARMVREAGFPIDDLKANIAARVAVRSKQQGNAP